MRTRVFVIAVIPLAALLLGPAPPEQLQKSPDQELPPHITRLTLFGERADFSHDGKRVLFLEKTFGDVYEVDLETKQPRLLTGHYPHHGYTRALYLANGDILLSGPEQFDPKHPGDARVQCFLSVLDKGGTKPPTPLGTKCSEGPAVSRKRMHIAWTHVAAQYPDEMPRRHVADLRGRHRLRGRHAEAGRAGGWCSTAATCRSGARWSAQNFRPPDERELTFSAYGHQGTDVCGVDLADEEGHQLLRRPRPVRRAGGHLPRRPLDPRRVRPRGPERPRARARRHLEAVARRQEDVGAADLLQQVPRLQGVQPGRQRRRQVHGLPDGQVARPGGRRLRDLPLRVCGGREEGMSRT